MRILIVILTLTLLSCNNDDENIYFELSQDTIEIRYSAEKVNISISSNTDWEIINIPNWVSFISESGNGDDNLEINLTQNNEEINGVFQSRTAEILFVANNQTYLLKIIQGSLGDIFLTTTSSNEYELDYNQQTITLEISSNEIWNLLNAPDWIDVSLESGNGEKVEVTLTITENLTNADREGSVIFGIIEPHWLSIYIKQNKMPIPIHWELITDYDFGLSSISRNLNFIVDNNGNPFIGFSTYQTGGDSYFHKYDGSSWLPKGTFEAYNPKIVFDSNNTPYVLYEETPLSAGGINGHASLKSFTGNWEVVRQNFSSGKVAYMDITIDSNNIFYIVYSDLENSGKIVVQKYDGTNLTTVGLNGFSNGAATSCQIELDKYGKPIVSYIDLGLNNQVIVKSFNGADWVIVGQEGISDGEASNINLQINNDNIVVAYKDLQNSNNITVKEFSNGIWEMVGNNASSNNEIKTLSLSIHNDILYLAYINSYNNSISVKKYLGSEWEDMGQIPTDISLGYSSGVEAVKVAISSNGTPFISFIERERGIISVIKHKN